MLASAAMLKAPREPFDPGVMIARAKVMLSIYYNEKGVAKPTKSRG